MPTRIETLLVEFLTKIQDVNSVCLYLVDYSGVLAQCVTDLLCKSIANGQTQSFQAPSKNIIEIFQCKCRNKQLPKQAAAGICDRFHPLDGVSNLTVKSMDRAVGCSMAAGPRVRTLTILQRIITVLELS